MIARKNYLILVASMLLAAGFQSYAQMPEKVPYYINLNSVEKGTVHEVSDQRLNLEYYDAYGTAKEFLFKIYDWKRNMVASFRMDKAFGLNNYVIKLDEAFNGWELNQTYIGELVNEAGTLYKLPIRIVPPPDPKGPEVTITVNPLEVGCKGLSTSLVEFYGVVSGGKAPYSVSWFVLNNTRTDFLYQPKEELISLAGKTPLIRVDKNPEYYVVLYVKDACGKEGKRIVNMVCENNRKKINTIFVEELGTPMLKNKKIQ